jgi:hypothetical protein
MTRLTSLCPDSIAEKFNGHLRISTGTRPARFEFRRQRCKEVMVEH